MCTCIADPRASVMHYIWQLHLPAHYHCQAMLKWATLVVSTPACGSPFYLTRGSGVGQAPERRKPRLVVQPMSSAVTRGPSEMSNDENVHKISSQGFSLQVDAYEQGRPGYPLAAVQYALKQLHLDEGHKMVVDLAAGTGKLTRLLAQQPNLDVVAVEPNEAMVGKFRALQPHIQIHQAAAQDLPFEDSSVDAVCAAQAFHWFANEDSLREIYRVLKPTGGFIMFANREDDRDPWARAILCSFEPYSKGIPQYWTGDWVNVWRGEYAAQHYDVPREDPRSRSVFFEHNVTVTRQQAWARIVSRSYLAILPEEKLAEIKATFESVLDANKDRFHSPSGSTGSDADSEVAEIPLRLEVFIARKR